VEALEGKRVLVTGGASGIGKETVLLAAEQGAHVIAGDMDLNALEELVSIATARNLRVAGVPLDVTDSDSIQAFVDSIDETPHGIVCSAGTTTIRGTLGVTVEAFDRVVDVNLKGTFFTVQAVARRMVPERRGSIVTISSSLAFSGQPGGTHYTTSKGGV